MTSPWLKSLNDVLPNYLQSLVIGAAPARFLPCLRGATKPGQEVSLGFSCFALKLYYMLNLWDTLSLTHQSGWLDFIKSFQVPAYSWGDSVSQNAFIDPPVINYLHTQIPWFYRKIGYLWGLNGWQNLQQIIIAETKQAVATLAQVGVTATQPYTGISTALIKVDEHMRRLDWSHPWGAGGQASAMSVFLKTEAPQLFDPTTVDQLSKVVIAFFEAIADKHTGAYYQGDIPDYGQLINGAMKVLTALDWLDTPIHYPEQLIDSGLAKLPSPEGCHLVDTIYVLYRCGQQTEYRKSEVQIYCRQVLTMIEQHHNPDGGFSYHIGHSQTFYYGVPIAHGFQESDIHGTCLLVWAVIMILEILDENIFGWQVIKP